MSKDIASDALGAFKGKHNDIANYSLEDLMVRLNEELAEVIQANVKMQRFGVHDRHPTYYGGQSNWEHFMEEINQVENIIMHLVQEVQNGICGTVKEA